MMFLLLKVSKFLTLASLKCTGSFETLTMNRNVIYIFVSHFMYALP
ncbi:hypothetical protein ACHAXA_006588 [Cyclostephanos tholiformis]|uniref:Uncharacterized protein n=1 Tax=Cyclostephanos tholiformis TaxID=382380 RepID=A0ABD3R8U9_9STRA